MHLTASTQDGRRVTIEAYDKCMHGQVHCPSCGVVFIAKRGEMKQYHFAHKSNKDCDAWRVSEMTAWHRWWQAVALPECQEVTVVRNGVRHIADVMNPSGTVLEMQHSVMKPAEAKERERFYDDMVWIMDATSYDCVKMLGTNIALLKTPHAFWSTLEKPVFIDTVYGLFKVISPWRSFNQCIAIPVKQALLFEFFRTYFGASLLHPECITAEYAAQRKQMRAANATYDSLTGIIKGNGTYPYRQLLRKFGFEYDASATCWNLCTTEEPGVMSHEQDEEAIAQATKAAQVAAEAAEMRRIQVIARRAEKERVQRAALQAAKAAREAKAMQEREAAEKQAIETLNQQHIQANQAILDALHKLCNNPSCSPANAAEYLRRKNKILSGLWLSKVQESSTFFMADSV